MGWGGGGVTDVFMLPCMLIWILFSIAVERHWLLCIIALPSLLPSSSPPLPSRHAFRAIKDLCWGDNHYYHYFFGCYLRYRTWRNLCRSSSAWSTTEEITIIVVILFCCYLWTEPGRTGGKAAAHEVLPAGQGRSLHHAVPHRVCHRCRAWQAGGARANPQCHCRPPEPGVPARSGHATPGNALAHLSCIRRGRNHIGLISRHSTSQLLHCSKNLWWNYFFSLQTLVRKCVFRHWVGFWQSNFLLSKYVLCRNAVFVQYIKKVA